MIEEKPKPQQNVIMGPFCQSCGMPMVKPEDYCNHCFKKEFTEPNVILQEMQQLISFG